MQRLRYGGGGCNGSRPFLLQASNPRSLYQGMIGVALRCAFGLDMVEDGPVLLGSLGSLVPRRTLACPCRFA